ncbi:MAG: TOBE-like domain-containing protein [Oligoflexia bacterium]|nr:TOBE-like domain-containing protein [Oligoflexia bacterium]
MNIIVKNISKTFGTFKALDNINFELPQNQLIALLGPSGSGKTTLLRIMAGLEEPDVDVTIKTNNHHQQVSFNGINILNQPPGKRQIGFVFQHFALFRHMSVFDNIAFGLQVKPKKLRPSKDEIKKKVNELLQLIKLENMSNRYPSTLSGGQRQRVALARALAIEPQILLLDEPFGSLDAKVRTEMRRWLRNLHDALKITGILVTHDQEEALEVADTVIIMNQGKIEQIGTPNQVFHSPASEFVMRFLGEVNVFQERIMVRPHELGIHLSPDPDPVNTTNSLISARITKILTAGPFVKIELLDNNEQLIKVHMSHEEYRSSNYKPNANVYVSVSCNLQNSNSNSSYH